MASLNVYKYGLRWGQRAKVCFVYRVVSITRKTKVVTKDNHKSDFLDFSIFLITTIAWSSPSLNFSVVRD
jgi:hypothetical protein